VNCTTLTFCPLSYLYHASPPPLIYPLSVLFYNLIVALMPLKKRAANAAALVALTPRKRVKFSSSRGTASQPISVESQALFPPPATTFEVRLRELQAEEAIVAPAKGSECATVASCCECSFRSQWLAAAAGSPRRSPRYRSVLRRHDRHDKTPEHAAVYLHHAIIAPIYIIDQVGQASKAIFTLLLCLLAQFGLRCYACLTCSSASKSSKSVKQT
jgi:hypothetical protein